MDFKTHEMLKEFVCGLVAGVVSVSVCHPLDVIRTRMNIMVYHLSFREDQTHLKPWRSIPA
jgi:hypothetical protein